MTVYFVLLLNITDPEGFRAYQQGFMEIFSKYEGQVLAVAADSTAMEGEWPYSRTVILSFPNADALNRWYDAPEYKALAEHRHHSSTGQAAMVPGIDNKN
jgi:uncharacterized protein (DUF1330 family)